MSAEIRELLINLAIVVAEEAEKNAGFRKKLEKVILGYPGSGEKPDLPEYKPVELDLAVVYRKDEGVSLQTLLGDRKYSKDKLQGLCQQNGIEVKSKWKKADYVKALIEAAKETAEKTHAGEITGSKKAENTGAETETASNNGTKTETIEPTAAAKETVAVSEAEMPVEIKKYNVDEINPVRIYSREGIDKLKEILDTLTVEELHKLIRRHGMDTARRTVKWKDADRLKGLILERAEARATQGDVFLNYKK
ncbi:MAG: hypothetical protein IJ899_16490 [Blautia sp.]|nr:hypothetical protein [Blautia sp.]